MSKTIKSIICPQCHAPEAEKLSNGNYKCAYCGCTFFVDDGTPNVSINQNINININNTFESAQSYNERSYNENIYSENKKKYKQSLRTVFRNIIALSLIFTFFYVRSSCSKQHIDEAQAGTLSQNLMGEKVIDSKLAVCKDRPAFLTITKDNYGSSKHLKVIFAENFDTVSVNAPHRLEETLPGKFLPGGGGWYALTSGNRIYHFDYQDLCFNDITDSVAGIEQKLQKAGISKILWTKINDEIVFSITSADGKEYFYHPSSQKVYDSETVKNIKPVSRNTVDKGTVRHTDIGNLIYQDEQCLLVLYEINDIAFLRKTDIQGNEIWTKKSDYFTTNGERLQTDSLTIISIKRYDDYYHPERKKYPRLHDKTTECYLYVRNHGDSLQYVLKAVK